MEGLQSHLVVLFILAEPHCNTLIAEIVNVVISASLAIIIVLKRGHQFAVSPCGSYN